LIKWDRESLNAHSSDIFRDITENIDSSARSDALVKYRKNSDLAASVILEYVWEGYHLLRFATAIRKSGDADKLEEILVLKGISGFSYIQGAPSSGYARGASGKVFECLAEFQDKWLDQCLLEFLLFCKNEDRTLVAFSGEVKVLRKAIAQVRKSIRRRNKITLLPKMVALVTCLFILLITYTLMRSVDRGSQSELTSLSPNDSYAQIVNKSISEIERQKTIEISPIQLSLHLSMLAESLSKLSPKQALEKSRTAYDLNSSSANASLALVSSLNAVGMYSEAVKQLEITEKLVDDSDLLQRSKVETIRAAIVSDGGAQINNAIRPLQDAMLYADLAGDQEATALNAILLSIVLTLSNQVKRAESLMDGLFTDCGELQYVRMIGACYEARAEIESAYGRQAKNIEFKKHALNAYKAVDNKIAVIRMQNSLIGSIIKESGIEEAKELLKINLEYVLRVGDKNGERMTRFNLENFQNHHRLSHDSSLNIFMSRVYSVENQQSGNFFSDGIRRGNHPIRFLGGVSDSYEEYINRELKLAIGAKNRIEIAENAIILGNIFRFKGQKSKAKEYYNFAANNIEDLDIESLSSWQILPYRNFLRYVSTEHESLFWSIVKDKGKSEDDYYVQSEAIYGLSLLSKSIEARVEFAEEQVKLAKHYGDNSVTLEKLIFLADDYKRLNKFTRASETLNSAQALEAEFNLRVASNLLDVSLESENLSAVKLYFDSLRMELEFRKLSSDDLSVLKSANTFKPLVNAASILRNYDALIQFAEMYLELYIDLDKARYVSPGVKIKKTRSNDVDLEFFIEALELIANEALTQKTSSVFMSKYSDVLKRLHLENNSECKVCSDIQARLIKEKLP